MVNTTSRDLHSFTDNSRRNPLLGPLYKAVAARCSERSDEVAQTRTVSNSRSNRPLILLSDRHLQHSTAELLMFATADEPFVYARDSTSDCRYEVWEELNFTRTRELSSITQPAGKFESVDFGEIALDERIGLISARAIHSLGRYPFAVIRPK